MFFLTSTIHSSQYEPGVPLIFPYPKSDLACQNGSVLAAGVVRTKGLALQQKCAEYLGRKLGKTGKEKAP